MRALKEEKIIHPIPPLYREDARILILGSFPSVKSREAAFFQRESRLGPFTMSVRNLGRNRLISLVQLPTSVVGQTTSAGRRF